MLKSSSANILNNSLHLPQLRHCEYEMTMENLLKKLNKLEDHGNFNK